MPERRDANLFEILIDQVTQNIEINIILGKALRVLPETELSEPVRNLLHRRPSTDLTLSVLDRHVSEFTNTRQDPVVRAVEPGTLKVADWGSGRIAGQPVNVRFVSKADIEPDVRFARAGSSDRCNREWVEVLLFGLAKRLLLLPA